MCFTQLGLQHYRFWLHQRRATIEETTKENLIKDNIGRANKNDAWDLPLLRQAISDEIGHLSATYPKTLNCQYSR